MQKIILQFIFLISISIGFSQNKIKGTSYTHFQLIEKKDTIDFVVADTNLSIRKPLLLFFQGSLPVPLFFDLGKKGLYPSTLGNFNLNELNKWYHVAVVSMPKTPLVVGLDHLNKSYNYVKDTSNHMSFANEYLKADFAENYVNRANCVLNYLYKQPWINNDTIVLAGHSQGTQVAVMLASKNKKITRLGLFSYDPFGRVEKIIRQIRKDAVQGKITWEKADSLMNERYEFNKAIHDQAFLNENPSYLNWYSFAEPTIDKLLKLKIPIFVAYGTEDNSADLCDYLPLYFERAQKNNLFLKRYLHLEHNFFPISNGRPDYKNGKWSTVMNDFIQWSIQL